jgi:Xaa-Pro aminopeptidase
MTKLKKKSVALIHSNDEMPRNGDQTFPFRQNSDFFYLTGICQEESALLLFPENPNEKEREILFILKPDLNLEIWNGHKLTKEEAKLISGIEIVKWVDELDSVFRNQVLQTEKIYINLNESPKFFTEVDDRNRRKLNEIRNQFPLHKYRRLAPILRDLRLIKEPEEIELIQKACNLTSDAFHRILKFIKPGVKEYEIEAEITHEFIRNGANGHSYQPIIASEKDSCVLHYVYNDKICKDDDLILMDFGAEYAGYAADTTRTVPANGKFSLRQREVYEAVLRIFRKTVEIIKPGTTISLINLQVNDWVFEELVNLGLSKSEISTQEEKDTVRMKYYMHGTSHFMGLDVHDVGAKDTILFPGMVLSCEPGIYIAEENIGIRLENDILVTETGQIDLLADEPIEIDEIEKLMNRF